MLIETNWVPSWDFELGFRVGLWSWTLELDFGVGFWSWTLELDFGIGLSSWIFELDFRVWISSWTFQQEASADVTADLDPPPPPFFLYRKQIEIMYNSESGDIIGNVCCFSYPINNHNYEILPENQ